MSFEDTELKDVTSKNEQEETFYNIDSEGVFTMDPLNETEGCKGERTSLISKERENKIVTIHQNQISKGNNFQKM